MSADETASRILVLMRHATAQRSAESSAESPAESPADSVADHDRSLDPHGRGEAATMAGWLREQGVRPDLVVASTATRVRETLEPFVAGWGAGVVVRYDRQLYLAEPRAVLDLIADTPRATSTLMVVGHNPTIQDLARRLGGVRGDFPSGGIAVLRIGDWADPLSGEVLAFATPATVPDAGTP